ncbi:MAG: endonuclease VII domain-containing protein [Gemmataceae bacterium]|nr:endonuclease VII domain-containing protein [Gemmataceae bacterium]
MDKPDDRTEKRCANCKEVKAVSQFCRMGARYQPYCCDCQKANSAKKRMALKEAGLLQEHDSRDYWTRRRWSKLKAKYGITKDQYLEMHASQDGKCAICGRSEQQFWRGERLQLCVDHCHKTGKIRGLLCKRCNIGLGHLDDSVDFLNNAITYLQREGD